MSKWNPALSPSLDDSKVVSLKPAHNVRYRTGTLVIAAALAALAAAAGLQSGPADSRNGVTLQAAENANASDEFVYFPAQYLNQASEPSEHIQAF